VVEPDLVLTSGRGSRARSKAHEHFDRREIGSTKVELEPMV